MGRPFELSYEAEVEAAPEEVWQAISTGPGLDAWFMGRNEVEPREGGRALTQLPGSPMESTVVTWQPPTRLVMRTPEAEDGSFHTLEYTVERRGSRTGIRWDHTGFLGADHWEAEYEGMSEGDPMYFAKLAEYLTYFRGRTATPVNAFRPGPAEREPAWAAYRAALGLDVDVELGDAVVLTPAGLPRIDGVVDYRSPSFLGVRSGDSMVRFMHIDWNTSVGLGHHLFAEGLDQGEVEEAWAAWLAGVFP